MQFPKIKKNLFLKLRNAVAMAVIVLGATFGFGASIFNIGANMFSMQERIGAENSKIQLAVIKGLFAAKHAYADHSADGGGGCGTCACGCTGCACGAGGW